MRTEDREQDLVVGSQSRMPFWECEQGSLTIINKSVADVQGEQDFCLENFRQVQTCFLDSFQG